MYITHFASTADIYGDMCIVDFDNYKIMIDGGKTKSDVSLLHLNMIGNFNNLFILSHWHRDHYAYLSEYPIKTILGRGCNGQILPDANDLIIETGIDFSLSDNIKIYASHLLELDDENSNSMVTVIIYGDITYFSFGDATPEAISSYNKEIFNLIRKSRKPIIKLPHHGSKDNCYALLDKINNRGNIRYIISGLGGDYVFNTVNAVLGVESNYLYWVAKNDSNYCKTSAFQQAQINYGNRFVFTNRVTVNPDGSISYF